MEPSPIGKNLTVYYLGEKKWPPGFTKTNCPPPFSEGSIATICFVRVHIHFIRPGFF
jgi:hypothetical protein